MRSLEKTMRVKHYRALADRRRCLIANRNSWHSSSAILIGWSPGEVRIVQIGVVELLRLVHDFRLWLPLLYTYEESLGRCGLSWRSAVDDLP
jgi:hypothetical protein